MQVLKIVGYLRDRLVGLASQSAYSAFNLFADWGIVAPCGVGQTFMPAPDHCVNFPEESDRAFDSALGPAQFVFNRSCKQDEQSRSVGTKCSDHFVRIDTVTEA